MIKDQGDQKPFIKKPWSMIKGPKKSMVPLIKVRWTLIFWEHHLDQGQVDVKPLNFLTFLYVQEYSFLLLLKPEDWSQFYYRVWLEVARLCSIFQFICHPCLPDQVSWKDDSWTINLLRHDVFLSRRCESSSRSLLLEYVNVHTHTQRYVSLRYALRSHPRYINEEEWTVSTRLILSYRLVVHAVY